MPGFTTLADFFEFIEARAAELQGAGVLDGAAARVGGGGVCGGWLFAHGV